MLLPNYISPNRYIINAPLNKIKIKLQLKAFKIYFIIIYADLFKDYPIFCVYLIVITLYFNCDYPIF